MFRLADSRTLLLLVATHCVLVSLVRCQQEDDRKLEFFTFMYKVHCLKLYIVAMVKSLEWSDANARFTFGLWMSLRTVCRSPVLQLH